MIERKMSLNELMEIVQSQKLSGDFNRGYTRAIQDIQEIFEYIEDDLKHHNKRLNGKLAKELLQVILTERENIRESRFDFNHYKDKGFIRYNPHLKQFEWFKRKENA